MHKLKHLPLLLALALPMAAHPGVYEDMMQAISIDDEATVGALLKRGMDVDTVSPKGEPLLTLAVREGKPAVIRTILAHRPKINARNANGETALMLAAIKGQTDTVKALLEAGGAVNQPGWNPLIYAATTNQLEIARMLLAKGANVDGAADNGTTALMMAAREGHLPMVLLLMEHGADINHKTPYGYTALSMAQSRGKHGIVEVLTKAGARE